MATHSLEHLPNMTTHSRVAATAELHELTEGYSNSLTHSPTHSLTRRVPSRRQLSCTSSLSTCRTCTATSCLRRRRFDLPRISRVSPPGRSHLRSHAPLIYVRAHVFQLFFILRRRMRFIRCRRVRRWGYVSRSRAPTHRRATECIH